MKRIMKYILVSLLFMAAYITIGERFVFHLAHFEDTFHGMTFEYGIYGNEDSNVLVKNNIITSLEKHSFDVFRVDTRYVSDILEVKTIYGTPGALEDLKQRGIKPQVYKSMLIGEVQIIFEDLVDINNIYESDIFYFIGTLEQAASFKNVTASEMSQYYQVKDIKKLNGSEDGVYATITLVWGIVFLLTIMLSLFNVILAKKETLVKLTLGENPVRGFLINSVVDILVFSILLLSIGLILNQFTHALYKFKYICLLFGIMIVINTLVNAYSTRISLKKDFSSALGNRGIIISTYVVKSITILMSIIILSANCIVIAEALNYFRQEKFFNKHSNMNYYKMYYSMRATDRLNLEVEDEKALIEQLWHEIDEENLNTSMHMFDLTDTYLKNTVLLNKNAMKEMAPYVGKDLYGKLAKLSDDQIYVFFPSSVKNPGRYLEITEAIFMSRMNVNKHEIISDYYNGGAQIIGINYGRNRTRSTFLNEPIIIVDTINHAFMDRYLNPLYFVTDFLYDIPEDRFNELLKEYNLENELITITNSLELYNYNRSGIERNLKLMSAISVFILLLEVLMIVFTVRLEYTINGQELSIKKTLGYSIIDQNIKMIVLPCVLIPVCTLTAAVLSYVFHYGSAIYIIVCGVLLLIAELGFVIRQCIKMDRSKTTQLLKGEKV